MFKGKLSFQLNFTFGLNIDFADPVKWADRRWGCSYWLLTDFSILTKKIIKFINIAELNCFNIHSLTKLNWSLSNQSDVALLINVYDIMSQINILLHLKGVKTLYNARQVIPNFFCHATCHIGIYRYFWNAGADVSNENTHNFI